MIVLIGFTFSYVDEDSNRKRCLRAIRENGKTKYIDITNEQNTK
jgi:hypothetical protein